MAEFSNINSYLDNATQFGLSLFLKGKSPLDVRSVVNTKAQLTEFKTFFNTADGKNPYYYPCMIVGCLEDGKAYILKSESEGFVEVGKETPVPIKSVSVNNNALTPSVAGNVNIDLSGYATKSDISSVYRYKDSDTWANISNITDAEQGDVYNSTTQVEIIDESGVVTIYPAGTNVAWNGTEWDALGGIYEQFISKVDATYFEVNNKQLTISADCPLINKIETIKLNGEVLSIQDKSVNIVIPEFNLYWNDITEDTTTTE